MESKLLVLGIVLTLLVKADASTTYDCDEIGDVTATIYNGGGTLSV